VATKQNDLFPKLNAARYGESRRHRNLFLPRYLVQDARDYRLRDKAQARAQEILVQWADLESAGKLATKEETTLQGEFLTQVFGEALGYALFSEGRQEWHISPAFSLNGGVADAAIGLFGNGQTTTPHAVVELKGPRANLDRDRFDGRTAVQQCWDYLNALPQCPWGIVCNYVSFRLYHRGHTPREYQLFTLQDLRNVEVFRQFYYLFEREGLLPGPAGQRPRATTLLDKTDRRQREVGDELYESYHQNRVALIGHLSEAPFKKPLDKAIRIAQKILDRIVFVAFCEDRGLLPPNSIQKAWSQLPPFSRVTNPRWRNFLNLFRSIDHGNEASGIPAYDGVLFAEDREVDDLELGDQWTDFFKDVGQYDFRDEVNLDVLGHLFERSVNDLERIRTGGLFGPKTAREARGKMPKSAERKRSGIYYTPPEFTSFITFNALGKLVDERFRLLAIDQGIDPEGADVAEPDPEMGEYWRSCLEGLRGMKVVDPACGSGAFLIQAYDILEARYHEVLDHIEFHERKEAGPIRDGVPDIVLHENLFGVDLSPEAVEITQLALWIRSARAGRALTDLSHNIICRNSLVSDEGVHPRAMRWEQAFPQVFARDTPGFDCVVGNPPWERMKLQEREFFDALDPDIAAAVNAATRRKLIAELEEGSPQLYQRNIAAKTAAEQTLQHVRTSGRFPLTGKGDINTYAAFAELAQRIVAPDGRVGLLVPSGIATDHTTRTFFETLVQSGRLMGLYDFENKAPVFADVHRSFKFCVLLFGGADARWETADFVFFARRMKDLEDAGRHVALSAHDLAVLNPNTRTCAVFRSRRDAELTKAIYRRVPVLVDKTREEGGNPWGIRFLRMFDQTNDAEFFRRADQLGEARFKRVGGSWSKGKKTFLPLYEAKMVQAYDHRAASVVVNRENWMRQGQTCPTTTVEHQNPEFTVEPRWWVDETEVEQALGGHVQPAYTAYKDVTSPTNMRTMIAALIPHVGVLNSAPLVLTGEWVSKAAECCLLANLNSIALDFVARQKVGGIHLNFFIVEQLPIFPPDFYDQRCPWSRREKLETWISRRVLKLTCTSNDMRPLAEAVGLDPPVHHWSPAERAGMQAELDGAYFVLYGIERQDVEYILSTFSGVGAADQGMFADTVTLSAILRHYDHLRERSSSSR